MGSAIAILIAALVAGVAGITTTAIQNAANKESIEATNRANRQNVESTNAANIEMQQQANETNLQIARENNAQEMDLATHGIQYKMADLQAAGLNPVLAASGFGGSPQATLSSPTAQAAKNQAPRDQAALFDFSGMSSAINAMNNMMLTKMMMDQRQNIANGYQQTSRDNNEARNEVLNKLYQRKAGSFQNDASMVANAKQIAKVTKSDDWDKMMKELKSIGSYKYDWKK